MTNVFIARNSMRTIVKWIFKKKIVKCIITIARSSGFAYFKLFIAVKKLILKMVVSAAAIYMLYRGFAASRSTGVDGAHTTVWLYSIYIIIIIIIIELHGRGVIYKCAYTCVNFTAVTLWREGRRRKSLKKILSFGWILFREARQLPHSIIIWTYWHYI